VLQISKIPLQNFAFLCLPGGFGKIWPEGTEIHADLQWCPFDLPILMLRNFLFFFLFRENASKRVFY